jgi:hypothetical protein
MHDLLRKTVKIQEFNSLNGTDGWGDQDLNAAADVMVIGGVNPIEIYRYGYLLTSAQDPDAGGFQLDLDFRPTAGSDAGRVNSDLLLRTDTQVVAAGKVVYKDVIIPVAEAAGDDTLSFGGGTTPQTSLVNVGPSGPLRVEPGQQAVLEISNANGAVATGFVFVEYADLPFNPGHANVIKDL